MNNKNTHILYLTLTALLCFMLLFPVNSQTQNKKKVYKLTILYTNDTHSRIESYPSNDARYANMGGYARRASMIKKIRSEEPNVLVFDAGDVFQGTPYFNYFGGELEFKLMSMMGYTAMNIGNHDFDAGLEGLLKQLPYATFDIISSNYDFSETILKDKIPAYKIYDIVGIKVGVFGLGVKLEGLVNASNYGKTRYIDPIEKAAEMAYMLKKQKKCDLVVCLSHLGHSYDDAQISDLSLAKQSKNIDIIIGGHTHTLLDPSKSIKNSDFENVIIAQTGNNGVRLGRIDLYFADKAGVKYCYAQSIKNF
ncbi:MAG: metallophosphatase [Bacteroidales bacterium]|nr:metallophosphatase [Bacteroidales bacterium]MDD4213720.1 metallophosphatase [Bacteroidales bacterium]